jgi:hypothetical protein
MARPVRNLKRRPREAAAPELLAYGVVAESVNTSTLP